MRRPEQREPAVVDAREVAGTQLGEWMLGQVGEIPARKTGAAQHQLAVVDACGDAGDEAADRIPVGEVGRELLDPVGDRDRQDLGHAVDRADAGIGKPLMRPLQQRPQHGRPADDDRVESRRRQLGPGLERAQHRVERCRHGEEELGLREKCEVLLGPRAGIRAGRRHRPVRAGDQSRHPDHQLIGQHTLAGPDADLRREVGEPGAEAGARVHDRLRDAGGARGEDDEGVSVGASRGFDTAAARPPQQDCAAYLNRRNGSAPRGTPGSRCPA